MARKTASEMFPLMELWEEGSDSREVFCGLHHISLSAFAYWRGRYLDSKKEKHSGFVEIQPEWSSSLEGTYPNGVKIRLPQDTSLADLRVLIELV